MLFGCGDEDQDVELPRNYTFDWGLSHRALGTIPLEVAVTAMFVEYAVLHGHIAGWVTSRALAPMNLEEAKDISRHAEKFILKRVTPILGVLQTLKVHKLLRHILDAIRLHGNLQNDNTSASEAQHKEDKVFYRRTNKTVAKFKQQIVRQAQGSREVLRRIKKIESDYDQSLRKAQAEENAVRVGAAMAAGGGAAATGDSAAASSSGVACTRRRARLLPCQTVAVLCRRPGLSNLAALLGKSLLSKVDAHNSLQLAARLDCGSLVSQTVRATPSFIRKPWYDAVLIDAEAAPCGPLQNRRAVGDVHVAEVRLLFRQDGQDLAVICFWEQVPPVLGCPLEQRGCARLRWALPPAGGNDWLVHVIPVSHIRRMLHVVPDFQDLAKRRHWDAVPPARNAAVDQQREMRFFVNAFFPWA